MSKVKSNQKKNNNFLSIAEKLKIKKKINVLKAREYFEKKYVRE